MITPDLQPKNLKDTFISLQPLKETDFEKLFEVASDPLIWEQHPIKDRYKRDVFKTFFEGAIKSEGAFLVIDNATTSVIGSSRFYDYDEFEKTIFVGYTFIAKKYWGSNYNKTLKTLMLNYAFTFADEVKLYIGAKNIRSQKAIEKLGAVKIGEAEIEYFGEPKKQNYIYSINKQNWLNSI